MDVQGHSYICFTDPTHEMDPAFIPTDVLHIPHMKRVSRETHLIKKMTPKFPTPPIFLCILQEFCRTPTWFPSMTQFFLSQQRQFKGKYNLTSLCGSRFRGSSYLELSFEVSHTSILYRLTGKKNY